MYILIKINNDHILLEVKLSTIYYSYCCSELCFSATFNVIEAICIYCNVISPFLFSIFSSAISFAQLCIIIVYFMITWPKLTNPISAIQEAYHNTYHILIKIKVTNVSIKRQFFNAKEVMLISSFCRSFLRMITQILWMGGKTKYRESDLMAIKDGDYSMLKNQIID